MRNAFPAARLPSTTRSPSTSTSPTNSFEGDETIALKLDKPSKTITLNAVEIDFHEVTVTAGGQTQTATVSSDEKNEMATFTVANEIPAGAATVHIKYTGHLNDKLRGLYLSTYNGRKYAVSQMEATDARVAFPSFDEPSYKATFDISAIVDKGDTAISNNEDRQRHARSRRQAHHQVRDLAEDVELPRRPHRRRLEVRPR